MKNAEMLEDHGSYLDMYGVAMCVEDTTGNKEMHLPSCHYWYEVGYCGLSLEIDGGKAYNMSWSHDTLVAQYECDEGRIMVGTMHGEWGWCRGDGSMEVPRCESEDDYMDLEFALESSGYLENGGYVMVRMVDGYGNAGDWEVPCDDGFNDNAAGAVCRSLGAEHGKTIVPNKKKMEPVDASFGWSNVNCNYDDTLMTSDSCSADRYGEEGVALCSSDEQVAVQCYDTDWRVDLELDVNTRKGKLQATVNIIKEDNEISVKDMDLWATFGAILNADDDTDSYVEFDLEYKMNKKGIIKAKSKDDVKDSDYDCFFVIVYYGDQELGRAYDGCE